MRFLDLLCGTEIIAHSGNPQITGIAYDSRRVKPGDLFVAMRGELSDGNRFIDRALEAGAVAIVTDSGATPENAAWAHVPHGRRALAQISANFFRRPADQLAVTGITGTNGKSTSAFLLESILAAAGRSSALVGTIEYHVGREVLPAPHTTPEALDLHRLFSEALKAGASETIMEVSSHALAQGRSYGISFDVAIFTNLTRDHLDYHHSMEEYFAAKKILFAGAGSKPPRAAVINADDSHGRELEKFSRDQGSEVITYGLAQADFHAAKLKISVRGTEFELVGPAGNLPMVSPLIGRVNAYNILAASAAAFARGCPQEAITEGVRNLKGVPGRFERVDQGQPFTVVVDYAHTDDALRNLTSLAREIVRPHAGRVITLFGCGGERDRSKRPLMGEAAGNGSDLVVVTSDNPRSEDPLAIIRDACVGLERSGVKYQSEPDRRQAIHIAIGEARPGDIVLLAGKGHEITQVVDGTSLPFEDKRVAADALRDLGYDGEPVLGVQKAQ